MSATTNHYRTAESVSPKHPDKLCDQISDAILDAHLAEDPLARVAIDVAGGHGTVFVTGEVTSRAKEVNISEIVRRIAGDVELIEHVAAQSPEIARGVDTGGAGDQGIMVGYATSETPEHLPLEVVLSRQLNQHLYATWPYDGKTQITLKDGVITGVVASFQKAPSQELRVAVEAWLAEKSVSESISIHVNPSGDWAIGGFDGTKTCGRQLWTAHTSWWWGI
jgi:S-adenosylmethionine synthetase